ncbi:MAG: ABC transporter permease [Candidatus Hadarchaeales archaeon]
MAFLQAVKGVGASIQSYMKRMGRSPALRYLKRDVRAWVGLGIVLAIVGVAIFADFIAPHDPETQHLEDKLLGPCKKYPLGTDDLGRCIFSRIVYGSRIALTIGILLVSLEAAIGVPYGLIAGYRGGRLDETMMRVVDAVIAFPGLVLAIAFVGFFGPGLYKLVIALSITGWAGYARLTRGQVLAVKEEVYIEAAKAIGERDRSIILRYVLPNIISPLIVLATMTLPAAILLSSAMSFLGLGVQPPTPDWGAMLREHSRYLAERPLMSVYPGIAIIITVLGFNFLGDALRDAFDPRLRG